MVLSPAKCIQFSWNEKRRDSVLWHSIHSCMWSGTKTLHTLLEWVLQLVHSWTWTWMWESIG